MKRGSWAKGENVKIPTKEEVLGRDEAWCHAVCLGIAEGQRGWEDVPEVSPAIKAVKKLRRDYEYERDRFRPARGEMASSPASGNIDMLRDFAEAMSSTQPRNERAQLGNQAGGWEQAWFEGPRNAKK